MVVVVGERRLDPVDAGEQLAVPRRDLRRAREDLVELLELGEPERGGELVEAVVEARGARA